MPSIRRSLIVYFLLLLALALSGMAFLADTVTARALADKETAAVELIDRTAADKEQEERDKFDRELLSQARAAARTAVGDWAVQVELMKFRAEAVFPLSLIGTTPTTAPGGWVSPVAVTQLTQPFYSVPNRSGRWSMGSLWVGLSQALSQATAPDLNYTAFLARHLDEGEAPLIQINSTQRVVWKSSRLPSEGLPFDRERMEASVEDWQADTVDLPSGPVRRVTLRGPVGGYRGWGWGGGGGPGRDQPRPGPPREAQPPPARPPQPPATFVNYYHVARPTTELEADVARIHGDAIREKAGVRQATVTTRRNVQLLLGLGSVVAFIGLLVGGWVLVGLGLRPLRKLTDAVSRVSERDFHLPVTANELSHELVPIHARLAQSLDELRQAFDREKQAVADISHELRTPVASMLATIDVTLRRPRTADQYKQALEDCRQLTKQLGGLVERVMTLAYLDAGQTQVNATDTDPVEVASGCAAVIRPLAESQGLTLTMDLQPTPSLSTDPDKLREVVINLLHNAVEYNRPGGSVKLAVRREVNGGTVVEVSDTGIGMTPDVRGRIFERFYRADASRTATGVHAGLGLAIVKEYVDRLGGTISVESEQDRGSTFRVTLPG